MRLIGSLVLATIFTFHFVVRILFLHVDCRVVVYADSQPGVPPPDAMQIAGDPYSGFYFLYGDGNEVYSVDKVARVEYQVVNHGDENSAPGQGFELFQGLFKDYFKQGPASFGVPDFVAASSKRPISRCFYQQHITPIPSPPPVFA